MATTLAPSERRPPPGQGVVVNPGQRRALTSAGGLQNALAQIQTNTDIANRSFLGQERSFQHGLEREALS